MRIVKLLVASLFALSLGGVAGQAQAGPLPAEFEIVSELNDKCLDVKDGNWVQTYTCHGGENQRWYWHNESLRSDDDGKCLDIKDANPDNGARVQVHNCNGNANQRWYWDGRELRSDLNGKCLDIKDSNTGNHGRVQMYRCHGGQNQRWHESD